MIITILIATLILIAACYVIDLLPLPASRIPNKQILYVVAVVIYIVYLVRLLPL